MNQFDPLHADERNGEFEESSSYRFQNDLERMKEAFGCLVGADWPDAFKLGEDYMPGPKTDWYYREKSVFAVGETESDGAE